jgi:hypothetical protein
MSETGSQASGGQGKTNPEKAGPFELKRTPVFLPVYDLQQKVPDVDSVSLQSGAEQALALMARKVTIGQCNQKLVFRTLKTLAAKMARDGNPEDLAFYEAEKATARTYNVKFYPYVVKAHLDAFTKLLQEMMPSTNLNGDVQRIQAHEADFEIDIKIRDFRTSIIALSKESTDDSVFGSYVRRLIVKDIASDSGEASTISQMLAEAEASYNAPLQAEIKVSCALLASTIALYSVECLGAEKAEEDMGTLLNGYLSDLNASTLAVSEAISQNQDAIYKMKRAGQRLLRRMMKSQPASKDHKIQVLSALSYTEAEDTSVDISILNTLESLMTNNFGFAHAIGNTMGISAMINTESVEMTTLLNGISKTHIEQINYGQVIENVGVNAASQTGRQIEYFNVNDALARNMSAGADMLNSELLNETIAINKLVRANLHPSSWSKFFGKTISAMSERFISKWVAGGYRTLSKQDILSILLQLPPKDEVLLFSTPVEATIGMQPDEDDD